MKQKIISAIILFTGIVIISSNKLLIKSNGAPVASTGAPRDVTCAKSGCHVGSVINEGNGKLSLSFNNGLNSYEAGKTYPITVEISQKDIQRFGFQLVAICDADTSNAGTIEITDSLRTQILKGVKKNADRKYITYKYAGTEPFAKEKGSWTFNWTAPKNYKGNITFYYGAIAANNDGTDSGDWVYHQSTTILSK